MTLAAADDAKGELERFYGERLGLPRVEARWVAFRAGPSVLEFRPVGGRRPFYHFALRVPRNRFEAARSWLARHAPLLPEPETGATIFDFSAWNAQASYAHDPCGNIVELVAHRGLPEEGPVGEPFAARELLGVCELGLVATDPRAIASALDGVGIRLWDGTLDVPDRLAFLGGPDGTLILARPGRGWTPTGRAAEEHEVAAVVEGSEDAEFVVPGTRHRIRTVSRERSNGGRPRGDGA